MRTLIEYFGDDSSMSMTKNQNVLEEFKNLRIVVANVLNCKVNVWHMFLSTF